MIGFVQPILGCRLSLAFFVLRGWLCGGVLLVGMMAVVGMLTEPVRMICVIIIHTSIFELAIFWGRLSSPLLSLVKVISIRLACEVPGWGIPALNHLKKHKYNMRGKTFGQFC